MPDPSPSTLIV